MADDNAPCDQAGTMEYENVCFVIMPFGEKPVGERLVNFDEIFDSVFEPAIRSVTLPEGDQLVPRRTDRDFFSGDISVEMFGYLEYSRFALADITGLNANVFYELGVRHRTRETGTAVFRQAGSNIPFDIRSIKAFDYEYEPAEKVRLSRELITRVLGESLVRNRLDSPVQIALRAQQSKGGALEDLLHQAENDIRHQDWSRAAAKYRQAIQLDPHNPLLRQKLGLFLKEQGEWERALTQFDAAIACSPQYAEAYREKGICENKIYENAGRPDHLPSGEHALRQAVALDPDDFDARASLGGVLKRDKRYPEALEQYHAATRVSRGHAYPLLNELKLEGLLTGRVEITPARDLQLRRAEAGRRTHVTSDPPYDTPWSYFDLAEIRLYRGDSHEALAFLDKGIETCTAGWQPRTHRESLELLADGGVSLPGLADSLDHLRTAEEVIP